MGLGHDMEEADAIRVTLEETGDIMYSSDFLRHPVASGLGPIEIGDQEHVSRGSLRLRQGSIHKAVLDGADDTRRDVLHGDFW